MLIRIQMRIDIKPEDVTHVDVILASSDSNYITEDTYAVDGGLMIQHNQGA